MTYEEVAWLFAQFGGVHWMYKTGGQHNARRSVQVALGSIGDAQDAVRSRHGTLFSGRRIHVELSTTAPINRASPCEEQQRHQGHCSRGQWCPYAHIRYGQQLTQIRSGAQPSAHPTHKYGRQGAARQNHHRAKTYWHSGPSVWKRHFWPHHPRPVHSNRVQVVEQSPEEQRVESFSVSVGSLEREAPDGTAIVRLARITDQQVVDLTTAVPEPLKQPSFAKALSVRRQRPLLVDLTKAPRTFAQVGGCLLLECDHEPTPITTYAVTPSAGRGRQYTQPAWMMTEVAHHQLATTVASPTTLSRVGQFEEAGLVGSASIAVGGLRRVADVQRPTDRSVAAAEMHRGIYSLAAGPGRRGNPPNTDQHGFE